MGNILSDVFVRYKFEELLKTVALRLQSIKHGGRPSRNWPARQTWTRGHGSMTTVSFKSLRTMFCSNGSLHYIAENCPLLIELSITERFYVEDESALALAEHCLYLKSLDLSDCYCLLAKSLEILEKNCCSLIRFSRNMLRSHEFSGIRSAVTISSYIPGLKHLELKSSNLLMDFGLMHFAAGCGKVGKSGIACCGAVSTLTGLTVAEASHFLKLEDFDRLPSILNMLEDKIL
ncbi:hypothetical protein R1sor_026285 [Riccia sorocarpa]|uniref:Uncharacterized protein n=1 Tax=Riccia sorocarpa TaxID=122646 RepID=A0ABD3GAZ7_9MARC